ncbi:hypothetical protein LEMLEM_LOCUS7951, partial [Lemmus lemmus]
MKSRKMQSEDSALVMTSRPLYEGLPRLVLPSGKESLPESSWHPDSQTYSLQNHGKI